MPQIDTAADITPILTLSIGRSGTTLMMRLMSSHPHVVARQDYPLEFQPFLYALFPENTLVRSRTAPDLGNPERFLIADAMAVYADMARAAGKRARYLVEKLPGGLDAERILAAVPTTRFLWLVRDPRDVLLSARAFDAKRGYRGFREQDGDSDETVVLKYVTGFQNVLRAAGVTKPKIVRYEELVGPRSVAEAVLADVFSSLGLDASAEVVRQSFHFAASAEDGRHVTSLATEQSAHRWRSEMPAHLIDLFAQHFGTILPQLGYAVR